MVADFQERAPRSGPAPEAGGEDPLSGLIGRDGFALRARDRLGRHLRAATVLTLIEIDHFDDVTGRFGGDCGAMVIRGVGQELLATVRGSDVVGRVERATFAVLHCDIDLASVRAVGERLRKTVQDMAFFGEDGTRIPVTVSVGIEVVDRVGRRRAPSLEACLSRATERVAIARDAGCNRVVAPLPRAA